MSTERRVTFTHFSYIGGDGVPVHSPEGDWQFESMTWLPDHDPALIPRKSRRESRRKSQIRESTALHGLLLILWKRERPEAALETREEQ